MKRIFFLLTILSAICADAQIVNRFRDSTNFYGSVRMDSIVRITKGAGTGKVLTSSANGTATWSNQIIIDSSTFSIVSDTANQETYFSIQGNNYIGMGQSALGISLIADSIFIFRINSRNSITLDSTNGTTIRGNLKYLNASEGAGKVLTSDSNGLSQWSASSTAQADSATIYALTPAPGTQYYCTDCTGNGITGRIVAYIGAAWRRLQFD